MIDPAELCEQALYDPDDTELWDRAGYALGLHNPNYPMPAIALDVAICPLFVDIHAYSRMRVYYTRTKFRLSHHVYWHRVAEWLKD